MSAEKAPIPPPVVPSERTLDEITLKAIVLGLVLAMLLAAANAYLGLRVGMTVAASIPASAVSLGVLRMFRKSTILENNMVQTVASAGASTVSGVIFTIPALVMMGAWAEYEYLPICVMVALGGILGVAFTVPLRRALIVDVGLQFPEGVATAEVLKTGGVERDAANDDDAKDDSGASGFKMLLEATGVGALFKLLEGGLRVLTDTAATTRAFLAGKWLFTIDATLAPSLLGIGFIVGLNIGVLMLMGAVIGTIIGVPVNWMMNSDRLMHDAGIAPGTSWSLFSSEQWETLAGLSWKDCRRIGVGCMIVGGVWSLITLAKPLATGIKVSLGAFKKGGGGAGLPRTERDAPIPYLLLISVLALVPLYFVFLHALGDFPNRVMIAGVMSVMMVVFGFLFSAVAGYMAGLVGSSNNPVSGVTMATVIVSSLILLQLMGNDGVAARVGPAAVIYLAAVICIGACIAGDNLQDLKCGHLVGATPWKQQVCLVVGAIGSAVAIPWVLRVLDVSTGIGRVSPIAAEAFARHEIPELPTALSAPQATLMKDVSTGIFGQGIGWNYIYIGFAVAVVLILLDKLQEKRGSSFRFPILAVAVGIYLPFGLSVLIFLGAVLSWMVMRKVKDAPHAVRQDVENAGMLLSSGLITGEALMGVIVALVAGAFPAVFPERFAFAQTAALVATGLMMVYLYLRTRSAARA